MARGGRHIRALVAVALVLAPACRQGREFYFHDDDQLTYYEGVATRIEYPDVATPANAEAAMTAPPRTLQDDAPTEFWDLSLAEATRIALANSKVMRDLGGAVVQAPDAVRSIYDPAIRESDPVFGVEAALAAFDAQLTSSVFWERQDRTLNNIFVGQGTRLLEQDLGTFQTQIRKQSATGASFAIRNNTDYTWNNVPTNRFPSVWNTNFEVEARQPFLQGRGLEFNRIAGPNATPGFFFSNGVMIARVNTDISLAEFETGVRNLVSDVENTYWDLYFAYRDFDAKRAARDASLETWRRIEAQKVAGRPEGRADKEAQAREQFFVFQEAVENALSGLPGRGTSSGSGTTGGAFRGAGGVYTSERRLRFTMGLPPRDDRLIRPSDEALRSRVVFDWEQQLPDAIVRRVELRRQRWEIKRRQLELIASRNFLKPRLDGVAQYRWRGFGDQLIRPDSDGRPQFDNAVQNLADGDFQEWQLGVQLDVPLGFRQAAAGVRNAQLRLARARALLEDQELQIAHELSDAVAELDRAYVVMHTSFNRRDAAQNQLSAVLAAYDVQQAPLELLLESQRRLAESDSNYYSALAEYALAIKNVHLEGGTLLDYNQIYLSEGPWHHKAYVDAEDRARQRGRARRINYAVDKPRAVSLGIYEQDQLTQFGGPPETVEPDADAAPLPVPGFGGKFRTERLPPPGRLLPPPPSTP